MIDNASGGPGVKTGVLTEWTWAAVLWLFRVFCLVWLAVMVLLTVRGAAAFLEH